MLSDAELLAGFEHASLPNDAFHHQEHVRVAWLFVRRHGLPDAIGEFSRALKRFADAKGKPNLYHETITWAFLLLIGERLAREPAATWQEFAARNPDLLTWKAVPVGALLHQRHAPVGSRQAHVRHARSRDLRHNGPGNRCRVSGSDARPSSRWS